MLGQQMFVASEASWEALLTCCSSFILLWVQLLVLQKPVRPSYGMSCNYGKRQSLSFLADSELLMQAAGCTAHSKIYLSGQVNPSTLSAAA